MKVLILKIPECSVLISDEWSLIPGKIKNPFDNAVTSISFFEMKTSCESWLELICNTNTRTSSQQMMVSFGCEQTIGGPVRWTNSWTWEKRVHLQGPRKSWVMAAQEWVRGPSLNHNRIFSNSWPSRRNDALFSRKSESSKTLYFPKGDNLVSC